VAGATPAAVGHAAWQAGVELHRLSEAASNLESVFLELTESQPAVAAALPPDPAA
jgi:ABC-2 type transport system ATP-binding protein